MTNTKRISISERPIIFNGEMVRAILDGRKTQTRRVVNLNDSGRVKEVGSARNWHLDDPEAAIACPYGQKGSRLWVRENWAARLDEDHLSPKQLYESWRRSVGYWADGPGICCRTGCNGAAGKVRPSIHMPRWASRITLEITDVRVEMLQNISKADCIAEGMSGLEDIHAGWHQSYAELWDSINGKKEGCSWADNPYVWVVEFKRINP